MSTGEDIKIAVSFCLLGEEVRYNGGHSRDRYVTGTLADYFRFVPLCPEVDIGLGTPRETIRLVRADGDVRLVGSESGDDHTDLMRTYGRKKAAELCALGIAGTFFDGLATVSPTARDQT